MYAKMFYSYFFVVFVFSLVLTRAVANKENTTITCGDNEWQCDDGRCVSLIDVRSGGYDACHDVTDNIISTCDKNTQYQCVDGHCISKTDKCNGVQDCPDGTDELKGMCAGESQAVTTTHSPDSTSACVLPPYPAHGRYTVQGAPTAKPADVLPVASLNVTCEPGYAVNGKADPLCFGGIWSGQVPECVSTADKCVLPPQPTNGRYVMNGMPTAEPGQAFDTAALNVSCSAGYEMSGKTESLIICFSGVWNGDVTDCTPAADKCILPPYPANGHYLMTGMPSAVPGQVFDTAVLNVTCDPNYDMNGKTEALIICFSGTWNGDVEDCKQTKIPCVLPPYPAHGSYVVTGKPDAVPGEAFDNVALNITCQTGYGIEGRNERSCSNGVWSEDVKDCQVLCHLDPDPSIEYRCLYSAYAYATSSWQWNRECRLYEHSGTVVEPQCRKDYFFPGKLSRMRCVNGKWNFIARCISVTSGACILPRYPGNGTYSVTGVSDPVPGQAFLTVALTVKCRAGFDAVGKKDLTCYSGIWSGGIVDCVLSDELCILPPFPANGSYVVIGEPNAVQGQVFENVAVKVSCDPDYVPFSKTDITCRKGRWSEQIYNNCLPKRLQVDYNSLGEVVSSNSSDFCRLEKDPSVNYRCLLSAVSRATRECKLIEPIGTIVKPECKVPNYYFPGVLNRMRCIDGKWSYIARCVPECGVVTPKGTQLVIGGRAAERGELPWHAAIYKKQTEMIKQICGGSIISQKVVISAGHCFLTGGTIRQPASKYAVAVGKLYRQWDDKRDQESQKSDLSDLIMPTRFLGSVTNFQEDIALLLLKETLVYQQHIRPICLDFDPKFENSQLQDGKLGKVAGWGLNAENGQPSSYLKVVELPFVPIPECQADAPLDFREYITGDKICAGYRNGTAVCKGDSGGGLAFPAQDNGKTRYYLRGLVSTAPNNNTLCNSLWLTMFTQVTSHERFIKDHIEA